MASNRTHRRLDPLSPEDLAERLKRELPDWRVADGAIERQITTSGWRATLMVVNAIGHLAEAAWHHPSLSVDYARVGVSLWTHDANGITERDLALAKKIDDVVMWRPSQEPGSVLEGPPADDPRHAYIVHGPAGR
jgi:4a-hydroxytetrahydrobiopterin dehydratase